MTIEEIFSEIAAERARQDARWGEQNHPLVQTAAVIVAMIEAIDRKRAR